MPKSLPDRQEPRRGDHSTGDRQAPRAPSSAISTSKAPPLGLDRQALGEQIAAVRQHDETSERDARRSFGDGIHR